MRAVFKYSLAVVAEQTLSLPADAKLLHVDQQSGDLQLWALIDPQLPQDRTTYRTIMIVGTGHMTDIPENRLKYINTFMINDGVFVFHAFEVMA